MATEVKRRRGTTAQHFGDGVIGGFTGATAELTVDTEKWTVHVHDNSTLGGHPLLRSDFSNVPTTAPFTNISLDTAIFDTAYSATGDEAQGTLYWNEDEMTLSLVTNGQTTELGQKVEIQVNSAYAPDDPTPTIINKGEVVYAFGTLGNSGRITVKKMIADGTIDAKRVLGVAAEQILPEGEGKIIKFGKLRKINMSAYNEGDVLWVSTTADGQFQNTEPAQGDISLPIAYVVNNTSNNGEIFIRVTPIDENAYQPYDPQLTTLSGLSADQAQDLLDITASEYTQLQNIDTVTISNTQWDYLGELDQSLTQASSPTFTGLTVNGATDLNGTVNIQGVLTTQNNLQDDGFTAGWVGDKWQIKENGIAEFQSLKVRGSLQVYEFIAKQISTIGGTEILSIAQGRVASAGSGEIVIENVSDPSTTTFTTSFSDGDLWIVQTIDVNTGSVTSVKGFVDVVTNNVLTVTVISGSLDDINEGDLIVAYGNASNSDRQNIIYRNVDTSQDKLITRVQTQVNDFNSLTNVANTRVAYGDLNGYSGLNSQKFGFFAGKNSNEHVLITDSGIFFKNGLTVGAQFTSNTFRLGSSTSYVSFNTSTGVGDIKLGSFDLESGRLRINSSGNTYPDTQLITPTITPDQTGFNGSQWTANPLFIEDKTTVKFYFDFDISVSGELELLMEVSTDNGSTWVNYADSPTTAIINMDTKFCNGDTTIGKGFEISVLSSFNNRVDNLQFSNPSGGRGGRYGRVAVYVYIADIGDADAVRFKVFENGGVLLPVCNATNIITQKFQSYTEVNASGVFTRLSDAIILSNGEKYLNPELIL